MDIDSIDFQAIANTGITVQEAADALAGYYGNPEVRDIMALFDRYNHIQQEKLADGTPITDAPAVEYPDGRKYRQDGTAW